MFNRWMVDDKFDIVKLVGQVNGVGVNAIPRSNGAVIIRHERAIPSVTRSRVKRHSSEGLADVKEMKRALNKI